MIPLPDATTDGWVPGPKDPASLAVALGEVLDDAAVPALGAGWTQHPTLAFLLAWPSLLSTITEVCAEAPPDFVVHRHQSIRRFQINKGGEAPQVAVAASTTVASIRNTRLGAVAELHSWCRAGDRPLAALRTGLLLGGATLPDAGCRSRRCTGESGAEAGPSASFVPQPGAAAQYAAVAGDHNPIHLDDDAAAAAGLPGPVLHGMLSLALAARAAAVLSGSADRSVQWLSGDFAAPATTTDPLTVVVRQNPAVDPGLAAKVHFTLEQQGRVVLRAGQLGSTDRVGR